MPVELATSPIEVVINDVNAGAEQDGETAAAQWGKKEAEAKGAKGDAGGSAGAKSAAKSDDADWHAKPEAAKKASGGKKASGRVDLTPSPRAPPARRSSRLSTRGAAGRRTTRARRRRAPSRAS